MFINFWYVAEETKKLTDGPMKVRMLGQDFVLFRDSKGKAHCLRNVCETLALLISFIVSNAFTHTPR